MVTVNEHDEQEPIFEELMEQPVMEENAAGDTPALDNMGEELEKARAEAKENFDRFLRMQADFDNFRKRTRQEKEDLLRYGSERVVCSLLPVLDNFERALQAAGDDANALREGVEMIFRQLNEALGKEGVACMDCVGKDFDPNFHEAVMQVETTEHPDNTVVGELQKGYMLHEKVLRPAMVQVAKNG